jgi:fructose-bisphosphate aldolase class II
VPDDVLGRAIAAGMTKINIATQLNKVMTGAVRAVLAADPNAVDPRRWLGPARSAVSEEVERLLKVLAEPRPRQPASL